MSDEQAIQWWIDRAVAAERDSDGLRVQLAIASERVAGMQHEAGMYHSLYDVATERLASARKALEAVWFDQKKIGNCAPDTLDLVRAELSLTDENGK